MDDLGGEDTLLERNLYSLIFLRNSMKLLEVVCFKFCGDFMWEHMLSSSFFSICQRIMLHWRELYLKILSASICVYIYI